MKSTHRVEAVRVRLEPHPNADSLSLVRVWGYTVCVRTVDWEDGDMGAYIVPDSVVPDTPLFAFLGDSRRIRVRRLRGVMSQGLLVPAPEGAQEGDDVAEALGVTRYEPPLSTSMGGGEDGVPPRGHWPVYDVESWHRYKHLLAEGEPVFIQEKIHGANGRWLFDGEKMHCGSRTTWKREGSTIWWHALNQNPWLEALCRDNPGVCCYGEVFGQVQDLRYGAGRNDLFARLFDYFDGREWLQLLDWPGTTKPIIAPILYRGPYSEEVVREQADGQTMVPGADHLREGCVIRPLLNRTDPEIGRVILKLVSDAYLERAK